MFQGSRASRNKLWFGGRSCDLDLWCRPWVGRRVRQPLDNHLLWIHYSACATWALTWWVLWRARFETEEPYRESRIRFRASTVIGIWLRRLSIFVVLFTGIWYLHRHSILLTARTTQLKIFFLSFLLFADQYFRNAVLPPEPMVEPKFSRATTFLLLSLLGVVITSLV